MTAATTVASTEHTRRAKGWPTTGGSGETATTAHVTKTGSAFVAGTDTTERNTRESKWTARDGYAAQGTDGRTASGSIHAGRD